MNGALSATSRGNFSQILDYTGPITRHGHPSLAEMVEKEPWMMISGSGLMADAIRAYPWEETPLGAIVTWSPELTCSINLVLAMPNPATLYWGDQLIMLYNDGYAEILADKHPASLGQPAASVFHEAWSFVASEIEAAWTGKTILREHVLIPIMRYGRMTDVYWSYSFVPVYEAGQIGGILNGSVHTAESLVKLSNKVVQTESLADRVLQSIADAVIVTDAESRITRMNAVAESLTGWTLSEARGLFLADVFRIVHERTRNTVEDPGRTVTRTGESISLAEHTVLLTRDGREISVGDSAAPIHDSEANLVGTVLVFRDISERRAAERERDEILTRLTEIMAASQDGISIIGRDWRILYQNPQADRMTAPEGDVIGRSLWDRHDVEQDAVEVQENVATEMDVVAVVAMEAGLDDRSLTARSKQLLKDGAMLVRLTGVVLHRKPLRPQIVSAKLRVHRDVEFAA